MGLIIGFSILCLLFAIIGFFFTLSNQAEDGVYPIGGPNGLNALLFFRKHPVAHAIYKEVLDGNRTESEIDKLLKMGAKAVVTPKLGGDIVVITDEMALAIGNTGGTAFGTKGQLFVSPHKIKPYIKTEQIKVKVAAGEETVAVKKKSIIGSAVAGSVVAGGVGAVVGAVAAASHNITNTEKTTTKYEIRDSGVYITYLEFKDGNGRLFLHDVYVTDDITIDTRAVSWAIDDILFTIKQPK